MYSPIENIVLTDSYKGLSYRNNLNDHITSVLDIAYEKTNSSILRDKELRFSKTLYWECLDAIYDNTQLNIDEQRKQELNDIKTQLYSNFIKDHRNIFNVRDKHLMETLDFTISNYIDYIKYYEVENFSSPWEISSNILLNDQLLYSFTDDPDDYKELLKRNKKESELSKNLTIGILAKGNRVDYTQSYVKDIYALRNLLLNLLEEGNHDRNSPLTAKQIIKMFRRLEIKDLDLSDYHIKKWIIEPLKKFTKLGSNKTGYFIILDEEDLYESYKSHFNNYKGFYKTLERHKNFAKYLNCTDKNFDEHNIK